METEISYIVSLIEKNKISEAINNLRNLARDEELKRDSVLLKRRISEIESSFNSGLLSFQELSTQKSRIALNILDIISKIEENLNLEPESEELLKRFYDFGNINLKEGNFLKAIHYFTKALQKNPKHVQSYVDRGVAKCAISSYEEALLDLKMAVDLDSSQPFAIHNLGIVYLHLGEKDKACRCWEKVKGLGFDIADENLEMTCGKNSLDELP